MKGVINCLLTIALSLPCLASGKSWKASDCTTQHSKETLPVVLFEPCTGDPEIFVALTFNETVKQCTDADGRMTTTIHFQSHGTGVGATTGNEYVLNSQQRTIIIDAPGCELSIPDTFHAMLVSKGQAPNLRIIIKSLLTIDSNCQPSSSITIERICKD